MTNFNTLAALPERRILDGTIRGHYAHLPGMTIGEVRLDAGTVVPLHAHPHEQISYVIDGQFEFTVDDETTTLGPGMAVMIPGGAIHGGKTLTECLVIDVFSPARDDYR
jgi:quercetin dioxygenase-like cupin family protein